MMRIGWGQENPAFRRIFATQLMPDATLEQLGWFDEGRLLATSIPGARFVPLNSYVHLQAWSWRRRIARPYPADGISRKQAGERAC